MRTLRKTLCLVLALVMILGLGAFSVASAADYTDADEIDAAYEKAVSLLQSLNVMIGTDDDGDGEYTFGAEDTFRRADAAVILTKLALGGKEPNNATSTFKDMEGWDWAQPYVAYMEANGLTVGDGEGYYNPDQTLTGAQWGLMLIRALGYKDSEEGITGENYGLRVAAIARQIGLDDGLLSALNVNEEIQRQVVAQLTYNSLTVPEVVYGRSGAESAGTALAQNFGLEVELKEGSLKKGDFADDTTLTGVIIANSANTAATEDGDEKVTTIKYYDADQKDGDGDPAPSYVEVDLDYKTGVELLGHYVTVYTSGQDKTTHNYQVASLTDSSTVVTVDKDITKAAEFTSTFGYAYKVVSASENIIKFDSIGAVSEEDAANDIDITNAAEAETWAQPGTYILDDAGVIKAYIEPAAEFLVTVKAVTTTEGKASITLYGGSEDIELTHSIANVADTVVVEYDDIAAKDIALAVRCGEVTYLTKAEPVSGSVSNISTNATTGVVTITLDGTKYPSPAEAWKALYEDLSDLEAIDDPTTITADNMKNKTYDLYLNSKGEWIAIVEATEEETEAEPAYAVLINAATDNSDPFKPVFKAQLLLPSGEVETVDTAADYSEYKIDEPTSTEGKAVYMLVKYEINAKTGKYTLKNADGTALEDTEAKASVQANDGYTTVTNGTSAGKINDKDVYYNSKTVFFVISNFGNEQKRSVKAYVGIADVPSLKNSTDANTTYEAAVVDENTNIVSALLLVDAVSVTTPSTTTKNYFILGDDSVEPTIDATLGTYYEYPAVVDGEITTVKVSEQLTEGTFYKAIETDKNGVITSGTPAETGVDGEGTVKAANDVIGLAGAYYAYEAEAPVYVIDTTKGTITKKTIADVTTDETDEVVGFLTTAGAVKELYITTVVSDEYEISVSVKLADVTEPITETLGDAGAQSGADAENAIQYTFTASDVEADKAITVTVKGGPGAKVEAVGEVDYGSTAAAGETTAETQAVVYKVTTEKGTVKYVKIIMALTSEASG